MTEQERQAIEENTIARSAAASTAPVLERAKGVIETPQSSAAEVQARINQYLASQGHQPTATSVQPGEDDDPPPLTPQEAEKAAADVSAFLGQHAYDVTTQHDEMVVETAAAPQVAEDEQLSLDVARFLAR